MSNQGVKNYWMYVRAKRYSDVDGWIMRVPCEKCGDVKTVFTEPLCNGCMAEEAGRAFPKIVNLTGHPIDFILNDGTKVSIPPAVVVDLEGREFPASVPRLVEKRHDVDYTVDGVPIVEKEWKIDTRCPLPEPKPGTYYIVSAILANAFPDRADLLCPETRKTRDGKVYAVALVRANQVL